MYRRIFGTQRRWRQRERRYYHNRQKVVQPVPLQNSRQYHRSSYNYNRSHWISSVNSAAASLAIVVPAFAFFYSLLDEKNEDEQDKTAKAEERSFENVNLPAEFCKELDKLLGPRFSLSLDDREPYSRDFSYHTPMVPEAVLHPETVEEVVEIVKLCNKFNVPLVPYGSGTSLEGHTIPDSRSSVTMSMKKLNKIKRINIDDMDAVVEPGLSYAELNKELKKYGLFFPLDPGPGATIGGMINTSCSGPNAVRYGTAKDQIISLKVVLADGRIVKTKSRAKKSSAGYDLTHLFIGSEGTLGIVVEATIKLQKIPDYKTVATCTFDSVDAAAKAVIEIMQKNIRVGKVELLDAVALKAVNLSNSTSYPEKPTLMFEFTGSNSAEVEHEVEQCRNIAMKHNGGEFKFSTTDEEREELWMARKEALWASPILQEGSSVLITDVCVPISRLADCLNETERDIKETGLYAPMVSHAGDGNFHLFVLFDANNAEQMQKALELNDRLVMRAISMEGTCTGEHGVGTGKMKYLPIEHGEEAVDVMRRIKHALDPKNILNPNKIFSWSKSSETNELPHGLILTNEQIKSRKYEH